jgi:hypothetical protein
MVFSNDHSNPRLPRQPRGFLARPERQKASFAKRDVARIHVHQEDADGKYVTMNSRSEGIAKNQTLCLTVFLRAAKKLRWIAHECIINKSFGPLGRRADSLVRERQRLTGGAARPEVFDPEDSGRSSSLRRRNSHVNRRPREPLGGASAQRHSRGGAENRHSRSLMATKTDHHFNSATALKLWRTDCEADEDPQATWLQFGHGVEAVENRASPTARSTPRRRFNSATALKPWRTTKQVAAAKPTATLQFGHGVEAVENVILRP